MKVKELIAELEKHDGEMEVVSATLLTIKDVDTVTAKWENDEIEWMLSIDSDAIPVIRLTYL